jgi:hypothetical protein
MRKLTKAEAGALGMKKARATLEKKKLQRVELYDSSPSSCAECNKTLSYVDRHKKFCNHTCAATHSNKNRATKVEWECAGCGKKHTSSKHLVKKYCSADCQHIPTREDTKKRLYEGNLTERTTIKTALIREYGSNCFECGISEWRGAKLSLELDHIDGNAGNNEFANLRLVCPNCHSITPTWKGRNKGNGRASRGLPLN